MKGINFEVAGVKFSIQLDHGKCPGALRMAVIEKLEASISTIDWSQLRTTEAHIKEAKAVSSVPPMVKQRRTACINCNDKDHCELWGLRLVRVGCCSDKYTILIRNTDTTCPLGKWGSKERDDGGEYGS